MANETPELDLQIGYPVLILSKTDGEIYPGIVYKQTIQKSIKGESSVWMIMVGPKEKRKVITTDKLEDFLIFKNMYELKEALFRQIMKSIETSVKDATLNLKNWYSEEIPLPILASALQTTPAVKGTEGKFKAANNLSFSDLAGQDAAEALRAQAAKEEKKKKPGRKPKRIEFEEQPEDVVQEASTEVAQETEVVEQKEEKSAPTQQVDGEETKIRVRIKGPNGEFQYVDADSIDSVHDISF